MLTTEITPADHGFIGAALEDAQRMGLGDDDTADQIRDCLIHNNVDPTTAASIAYTAVHGYA